MYCIGGINVLLHTLEVVYVVCEASLNIHIFHQINHRQHVQSNTNSPVRYIIHDLRPWTVQLLIDWLIDGLISALASHRVYAFHIKFNNCFDTQSRTWSGSAGMRINPCLYFLRIKENVTKSRYSLQNVIRTKVKCKL